MAGRDHGREKRRRNYRIRRMSPSRRSRYKGRGLSEIWPSSCSALTQVELVADLPPIIKTQSGAVTPQGFGSVLSLSEDCSAVLALSRTPRAGCRRCRKRHPGQHLCAALCRSAGRDEGMVAAVEQRDGSTLTQRRPAGSHNWDQRGSAAGGACKRPRADGHPRFAAPGHGYDHADAARHSGAG